MSQSPWSHFTAAPQRRGGDAGETPDLLPLGGSCLRCNGTEVTCDDFYCSTWSSRFPFIRRCC